MKPLCNFHILATMASIVPSFRGIPRQTVSSPTNECKRFISTRKGKSHSKSLHNVKYLNQTDIESRVALLEKQMKFWAAFKSEMEVKNPDLVASSAAKAFIHANPTLPLTPSEISPRCSTINSYVSVTSVEGSAVSHTQTSTAYTDPTILEDLYEFYALQTEITITIQEIIDIRCTDDLIKYAQFLHREYMVRLARRARSLRHAPLGLGLMPSLRELRRWYEMSFFDMRSISSIETEEDIIKFDLTVRKVSVRHVNTTDLISSGIYEFAEREQLLTEKKLSDHRLINVYQEVQDFFDAFCDTRVKLRFLLGHHIYCSEKLLGPKVADHVAQVPETAQDFYDHDPSLFSGQVCNKCDIRKVVLAAINETKRSELDENYSVPNIILTVFEPKREPYEYNNESRDNENSLNNSVPPFTFRCVPSVVYWIVSSLVGEAIFTNMMRKEQYMVPFTPINVKISQGPNLSDVTITVSDTAGGMSLPVVTTSLSYIASCRGYLEDQKLSTNVSSIRRGAGWNHAPIRIPYAVVAARSMGGDITVSSMEGVGTQRYLYIPTSSKILKALEF
eukprot:Tbor_TRINITY_DN2376_c0_g1::TRINITY_DN2376_c0_g1_i1::g.202::m.202/K00898/PDK2_3_4; pyruvate dehydrogenase kinase 2/3/4